MLNKGETSSPLAMRASEMTGLWQTCHLSALPGTDKECAGLKAQAEASGKPSRVFLGADATEAQLREINSPRLLHLATHGFFLPESEERGEERELGTDRMNLIGDAQKGSKDSCYLEEPDAPQRIESIDDALANQRRDDSADYARFLTTALLRAGTHPSRSWTYSASG